MRITLVIVIKDCILKSSKTTKIIAAIGALSWACHNQLAISGWILIAVPDHFHILPWLCLIIHRLWECIEAHRAEERSYSLGKRCGKRLVVKEGGGGVCIVCSL